MGSKLEYREVNFVVRDLAYFQSDAFDCSREHLLKELAVRAEFFCKQVDGTYLIPRVGGQAEQIIEMAIAAKLKNDNGDKV